MIVTTIRLRTDEHRNELVQTFRCLYQPKPKTQGCIGRHFYREIGNEDAVLLVEEWESERHWQEHLQSREFAVLLGAMTLVKDPEAVEFRLLCEAGSVDGLKKMRSRHIPGLEE